jgi:hypothetical protein
MDWEQIREYLERIYEERGLTQGAIAAAGGKPKQNTISRMLKNRSMRNGPHVINFLRALEGMGVKPSEFFVQLERLAADRSIDVAIEDRAGVRLIQLKRSAADVSLDATRFAAAQAAFWHVLAGEPRPRRRRKRR